MEIASTADGECVIAVLDGAVLVCRASVEIDVCAAEGVNRTRSHFYQSLRQRRIQIVAILAVSQEGCGHKKRRYGDRVKRNLVARVVRINEVEVVAHYVAAAGDAYKQRRELN